MCVCVWEVPEEHLHTRRTRRRTPQRGAQELDGAQRDVHIRSLRNRERVLGNLGDASADGQMKEEEMKQDGVTCGH